MKNKFKKSKIIVPALALITATTAASVTGTVAWFTAARTATVSASTFETKALSTSLTVKSTKLVGTTNVDTTASATSSITVDGAITHGSYNAIANNAGILYVANVDEDAKVTSFSSYGTVSDATAKAENPTATEHSKWWAGSYADGSTTKNIWYAVAWQMEFTAGHAADDSLSLFIDYSSCTFGEGNTGGTTLPGLRIAFITSTNYKVMGGEDETNHATGTTKSDLGTFGDNYNVVADSSYAKAEDKTTFTTNKGYLGAMTKAKTGDTTSTLTVTAVAWFEGESSTIVTSDSTIMSKVNASLAFYTRINA